VGVLVRLLPTQEKNKIGRNGEVFLGRLALRKGRGGEREGGGGKT